MSLYKHLPIIWPAEICEEEMCEIPLMFLEKMGLLFPIRPKRTKVLILNNSKKKKGTEDSKRKPKQKIKKLELEDIENDKRNGHGSNFLERNELGEKQKTEDKKHQTDSIEKKDTKAEECNNQEHADFSYEADHELNEKEKASVKGDVKKEKARTRSKGETKEEKIDVIDKKEGKEDERNRKLSTIGNIWPIKMKSFATFAAVPQKEREKRKEGEEEKNEERRGPKIEDPKVSEEEIAQTMQCGWYRSRQGSLTVYDTRSQLLDTQLQQPVNQMEDKKFDQQPEREGIKITPRRNETNEKEKVNNNNNSIEDVEKFLRKSKLVKTKREYFKTVYRNMSSIEKEMNLKVILFEQ